MVELIEHFRLKPAQQAALTKIGLQTTADLLRYFPQRYGEKLEEKSIGQSAVGDKVTLVGQVVSAKTSKGWKSKIPMGEMVIADQTGRIKAVWFRQPYLAKKATVGQTIRLSGKVAERKGEKYLANPDIDAASATLEPSFSLFADETATSNVPLMPVYPEIAGLSSLWFQHHIKKVLQENQHQELVDPLPAEILQRYHLPGLATALVWIHSPRSAADALAARKRFAFEKVFLIQLARLAAKARYQTHPAFKVANTNSALPDFAKRLNFPLTRAQERAIKQILTDLKSGQPMMRLLEGDVGSGKTAVAAATAQAVVKAGLEVAYMAPTEILAKQHFESFINYFGGLGIQVGLITGSECRKFPSKIFVAGQGAQHTHISRPQLLKWVANGEIPILVGTHALIQKAVKFKNLAYVIIDEQHRFGVNQRAALVRKDGKPGSPGSGFAPHLLSMTATPIPRTLALTVYGDLDLTLLDEMPAGRRTVITSIVSDAKRAETYAAIKRELEAGRQVYVICPRIDEPDPTKELALNTKSAKAEQKRLQEKIFPQYTVGLLHSKMSHADKEAEMAEFTAGRIHILVATSVVEVGVNVPNATVIIIEGAERFGLAQLHQLRGRVLRSNHQAYCYLFTTSGKTESARLQALEKAKNGFELAELDLKLRGAGALGSGKQWGLSDLGMEALQNLKMVEAARSEAQKILQADPELKRYPLLREQITKPQTEVHLE